MAGDRTPSELFLISRRRFVAGSAALAGASILGGAGCGAGESGTAAPPATPNRWIPVSIAGLAPGEPRWVEFDTSAAGGAHIPALPRGTPADSLPSTRGAAWLVLETDGSVAAFLPNCTHQRCFYDWDAGAARFECRCHAGYFGLDGAVIGGPPPRALWRNETRPSGVDSIEIGWVEPS